MLMGAVVRSVQIAGALEAVLAMSVRYANERVAFERPIAKFQAVQHNLARLAGEAAAAMTAADSAADAHRARDGLRRRRVPGSRRRRRSARPRPRRRAPRSRIRCTARSASPRSTCCIASRCACWAGATISATRATGRSSSAIASRPAAPTHSGRWWRRVRAEIRSALFPSPLSRRGGSDRASDPGVGRF